MPQVTEAEVLSACRTLFGAELHLNKGFLTYLQASGVRSAYRKKAKVIHPDRFSVSSSTIKTKQLRLFQDLNQAHQTVQSYLKQKNIFTPTAFTQSSPAYSQSSHRRQDPPRQQHWTRQLPSRPLQFGLFLYYLGIIPFHGLVNAVTWQRQQRPVMGEIARRWGWLNEENIRQIINHRGGQNKFGERAEQLGLLNSLQVGTLLFHQRTKQKQIGDYFVAQGFFNEARLQQLLAQLAEHNRTYRQGFSRHFYYFHR
ncbi:MAG: J domain-containing protein [Deltaproteobacteria bacterium]|nr:J domain-containing protein [Deltaproteobacteria bacterium]